MALTEIAHHDGQSEFEWNDLVDAMTTIEAGTAVGVDYIPEESRAVAIHEAGHAAAGHVWMKGAESTRLSIRMRGNSLGHHQALEEERFGRFRSDEFARLVWGLGAMAAERVFYGENSNGVGGDVQSTTAQAAFMVSASAMSPEMVDVTPLDDESPEDARDRVMKRFERISMQIMNRTGGGGPFDRTRSRAFSATPTSAAWRPRSSARRTSLRTASSCTTGRPSSRSRTRSSSSARSSATISCGCSTSSNCSCPSSILRKETWPKT